MEAKMNSMLRGGGKLTPIFFSIIMLFFILSAYADAVPLIGTCYHNTYKPRNYADGDYVDSTSIKSFRHGYPWGIMDSVMVANGWDFDDLADSIADYYPPVGGCMEPMFLLDFWHKYYTQYPGQGGAPQFETWKVASNHRRDFSNFCYNLAYALKARMDMNWFILHNEPDLYYDGEWQNWKSTPEAFADQCLLAAAAIKDAVPSAIVVLAGFANESTTNTFIRAVVDSVAAAADTTLIDYIDWHIYWNNNGNYSQDTLEAIAGILKAYCDSNGFGWTVLETGGPPLALPVDEDCPIDTTKSIREELIWLKQYDYASDDSAGALRDFLFDWCDDYEPLNLALPANKDSLEGAKVLEFNKRIPTFVDSGAAAVHWFGAYEQCLLDTEYEDPLSCWPSFACYVPTAEEWVDLLIQRAEGLPLNVIDKSGDLCNEDTFENTPLSDRMREYVDSVWENVSCGQQHPRSSGDNRDLGNIVRLYPNQPDPFNATTEIRYYLPEEMEARIELYNIAGQRVRTLFDEKQSQGEHSVIWDAGDLASGIYFCKLNAGEKVVTARMTLLK